MDRLAARTAPPTGRMRSVFRSPLRVLDDADRADVLALCAQDPVASIFVTSRVAAVGADPARLGGQLWGWCPSGRLEALCWDGANLVPVVPGGTGAGAVAALDAFATRARRSGRRCSSLVGSADAVMGLWSRLEGSWGPARDVRPDQPLMAVRTPPLVAPDPAVRRATTADLDVLVPACIAMFTEEVGYSPTAWDGGRAYRARVADLVAAGRSFVRLDAGDGGTPEPTSDPRAARRTAFKAELGAVSRRAVQVQGVFVDPALRGRGLAAPGTAAVAALAREHDDVVVSLYVNDFNAAALAAYRRAGFRQAGVLATVLF